MWWLWLCSCCVLVLLFVFLSHRRKRFSLRGKHVLITGGSSGIGKCLAAAAVARGASLVTLVARNKEKLEASRTELQQLLPPGAPQAVGVVSADVSDASVVEILRKHVEDVGVAVDVLVNCAGITHTATMLDTPLNTYQALWRVNVQGCVHVTKAVLDSMVTRQTGAVVFISSVAGQLGLYGYTAYSTTKFALRGLAETLHMELKPHHVQVSISFPPDTDTPQLQEELKERDVIQTALASYGAVFRAETIAKDVWDGVERGRFHISHGLDGFITSLLCTGMSPITTIWDTVVQVVLMGMLRLIGVAYLVLFGRVVANGTSVKVKSK